MEVTKETLSFRTLLGGPWAWLCSSPLSVSFLFLKFFELWSRFLRNDLKRKNVLLLAAKPAGLRGACSRIMTLEAEKWHHQLANIWNRCRKDRARAVELYWNSLDLEAFQKQRNPQQWGLFCKQKELACVGVGSQALFSKVELWLLSLGHLRCLW